LRILATILILHISSFVAFAGTIETCSKAEASTPLAKTMMWPYYITISASNTTICSGQCITISATVTGGHNAPYTFTWTGGGIPNANIGTGTYTIGPYTVCPTTTTTYTVSVTDAYNWPPATASVTITVQPPTALNLTSYSADATCGNADGTATVTATGGTLPYTYLWGPSANNQTTQTATGLGAGTYDVTVTDNSGCSSGTTQVTVATGSINALMNGWTDPSCSGDSDGTATVIAGGGTPPYTYAWGPSGGTGATGTGLTGGITYTVTVTESNGCSTTQSIMLTDPAPFIATIGASTDPPCAGGTGDATVGVSGGTVAYTYAWSPSGGTGVTGTGLSAGVMTIVLVTDANGCTANDSILLTEPPILLATVISNTPPTCAGGNDGTATAVAAGGTGSYTYVWTPTGGTGVTGTGLSAGTTTLSVTDANGCIASDNVTLVDPPAILVSIASPTDPTCFGGSDGTATGSAAGGSGTYSYSWSPSGGTAATGTGLSAGIVYTLIVTDGNGCSATDVLMLNDPPAMSSAIVSTVSPSCIGSTDGEATVSVSGGTPQYSYLWAHNGGTSATGTGMGSSTNYVVTITDSNNCTVNDTAVLIPNTPMTVNTTGSGMCFGSSTDLEVTVSGGLAPYSYLWNNAATGSSQTVSPTGLTTYSVIITDGLGCLGYDTITIAVTTALTVIDSAAAICDGVSITIYTQASGGSGTRSYLWGDGSTTTSITVSPGVNTIYSVTVTDTCGSATANIDVTIIEPPFVDFSMECDPNPYGLQFTNNSDPLVGSTFIWDFGDAISSTDQDPSHDYASTGSYPVQLTVTTAEGCTNDTTIMVLAPPDAAFIANPTETSTTDPEVHFTDWSMDPNNIVYWEWNFGDSTGIDNLLGQAGSDNVPSDTATSGTYQNPSHMYSDTGLFVVQLTVHDINNCIDTITMEIRIFSEYFLYAPSAFTPNYDGYNDVFLPTGVGIIDRDYELAVYNRWGDRIFESDDINVGWNGTANGGGVAQSDVYIWTLSTRDIGLKIHQYVGHVTLYR